MIILGIIYYFKKVFFFYFKGKNINIGCIPCVCPCTMCCFRYKLREKKKIIVNNLKLFISLKP
jgi:hypothetical protein